MRIFINEYTKILAYTFIGLLFAYCSFYLIGNIYHYQEIRKTYDRDINDIDSYNNINTNIQLIEKNIDVNIDNYHGSTNNIAMIQLKKNLSSCLTNLDNKYLNDLKNKKQFSIKDVENLRSIVVNDVVNSCLIENIYYITYQKDNIKFLEDDAILLKNNIDTINSKLDYINRDIINNSSLYFNTNSVDSTIYNKVEDNFNNLLDIYKESSDLVLTISYKYNREVVNND